MVPVALLHEMDTDSSEQKIHQKKTQARGLNQKFLDCFWQLADNEADARLGASLEIIQQLNAADSTESQLNYTIGRLVQGLASTRQCARHGYFVALVGILNTFSVKKLPNSVVYDAIKNRLVIEGGKKEKIDQQVGQVLVYGALMKSGRISETDEIVMVMNNFLAASKIKNYIQPVAFGFLEDLFLLVDSGAFKASVWPILKPELSVSWEEHNLDTLNLLLVLRSRFPKVIKTNVMKEVLGCAGLGDPQCFSELTKLILRNSFHGDHPLVTRIVRGLIESGTLKTFWVDHLDAALDSPTKTKASTACILLTSALKIVDGQFVSDLLSKNILSLLIAQLQAGGDAGTEEVMEALKTLLTQDDASPGVQISIMERLLKTSGQTAFDKRTDTRFIANVSASLKKEAVLSVVDIYRQFIEESSRTQDRIYVVQQLSKLLSHPAVQREVEWKASQLEFLGRWAYFTPSSSKVLSSAVRESFHRALDNPCKKLEDLSTVLSKAFDQINKLIPSSDLPEQVKVAWNGVAKSVKRVDKKREDGWTGQVFLVLYLNMGFELLRDPTLPVEIINELDTCYQKATEKKKKRKSSAANGEEDPHWLEVVTDILLSLLSRNQHLLRSIVISVWSLLVEHVTPEALQQVLDVIDPSKKEMPLVDEEQDSSAESEEGEEDEEVDEEEVEEEAAEEDSEVEGEDSDGMDEEETITDKLRMRIHEALGDSAALTDTESIDIDDLSDGQMESLDKALGSAFQEFRKARPVRKNNNKLPKDQTALMHFRLRCLDLIQVMTEKEVSIKLTTTALLPLLSLLEVTVKEPLQKPLMDRTRIVLRKLTNIRRFADEPQSVETVDDLVKLLQLLFSKPYAKRALMPYISDDLVHCCSLVLRCTLHLTRNESSSTPTIVNGHPQPQVDGVYQLYLSNLAKFFLKRDSPIPFGVFSRALVYPWPDAAFFLEPLMEYAFGATILKNRKLQALQLLTALFRNPTALSSLGQSLLVQRVRTLLKHSLRVLEAEADAKPKYLNELFILLRVVFHCPELAGIVESSAASSTSNSSTAKLWESLKETLTGFAARGLAKQKDLKKSFSAVARLVGVAATELSSMAVVEQRMPRTVEKEDGEEETVAQVNGHSDGGQDRAPTKKKASKQTGRKEKKEAKMRRMAASAEGFSQDVVFSRVDDDTVTAVDLSDGQTANIDQQEKKKKTKKRSQKEEAIEEKEMTPKKKRRDKKSTV